MRTALEAKLTQALEERNAEVEALMDLTHPNIVRLHEYYRDDDALYLVEEYCSGGTLEQRLEARGVDIFDDPHVAAVAAAECSWPGLPLVT